MKILELNQEAFEEWVSTRPPVIQALVAQLPPDRLYRIRPDGNRVTILSYAEDGTVTVEVSGQYNLILFARQVFGVRPDDLVECDLPPEDEVVGALLTEQKDIEKHIARLRMLQRRRAWTG